MDDSDYLMLSGKKLWNKAKISTHKLSHKTFLFADLC